MDSNSLSYSTLKNVSYSFLGYCWPIIFSIFITPVVVHKLGVAEYGIYILLNTITAFLSLIDLGLGSSLIKYVSEYYATERFKELNILFDSSRTLYLFIGLIGLLTFCLIGRFGLVLFHVSSQSQIHYAPIFYMAGLAFFINALNYSYIVAPTALQRYDISTKLSLAQLTIFNLGTLFLVLMQFKLKAIFLLNVLLTGLFVLAYRHYFKKLLPQIKLGYGWSRTEIKKAYSFGFFAALNNLASNSLISLDRFIIPIFTGPAQLTYYSLPGNVAQKTTGITGSIGSVFFPLTSALSGQGENEKIKVLYRRLIRNITLLSSSLSLAIIIFSYPILKFWMGTDFADKGNLILKILAATYFFLGVYTPLTHVLLGLGKVKFLTFVSTGLALVNLILLIIFVPHYGILGAAWAYLGGVVPVAPIFYWAEKKFLGLHNIGKFYFNLAGKNLIVATVFYLIAKYILLAATTTLWSLIILGPLSVFLYLTLYWVFGFMENEDKNVFKLFFFKTLQRINFFKK